MTVLEADVGRCVWDEWLRFCNCNWRGLYVIASVIGLTSPAQSATKIMSSLVSIAIIRLCVSVTVSVCDSVCLSVCSHDKIKTAETKIAKLGTGGSPSRYLARSKGQMSRSQGQKVQLLKVSTREPCVT